MRRAHGPAICLATALLATSAARAQNVGDVYRGQTLNVVVGSDPGGGYDSYARVVARHIGRLIPGAPNVALKYMPGAASLVASNWLANAAPHDGLTIGAIQRQIAFEPLRGNPAARYDPFAFNWLGSVTSEASVFVVWKSAPQKAARDLLTMKTIAASLGVGTDSEVEMLAMKRLLNAPIDIIGGYKGTPDALLAMERGEVHGVHGVSWSYFATHKQDWLKHGDIRPLLWTGAARPRGLDDAPPIGDLAPNAADRDVWELIVAPKAMSRPFLAPPGVAPERVAALRDAFERLMDDPEFRDDVARQGMDIEPMKGAAVEALVRRLYALPPQTVARMREAIGPDR